MENDGNGALVGFMAGLLIGAALGASVALLTAPRSGRRTRKRLRKAAGELREGYTHRWDSLSGEMKERVEGALAVARRRRA